MRLRPNGQNDHIQIHYYGITNRKRTNPWDATYRLAWTSSIPRRGKVGLEVLGDTKPAGEEGADEKLEIISVVDILAIVALEQGKLSAPSMFNLKCKLFALRNRRSIERDEELDVPKLASAVPLSKLSKRSRPKVHDAIPDPANGGSAPGRSLRSSARLKHKKI